MNMEHLVERELAEEYSEKTYPTSTLSNTGVIPRLPQWEADN
jgi:hypothetical protein